MDDRLRVELSAGRAHRTMRAAVKRIQRDLRYWAERQRTASGRVRDGGGKARSGVNGLLGARAAARVPDRGRGRDGSCAREDFLRVPDRAHGSSAPQPAKRSNSGGAAEILEVR